MGLRTSTLYRRFMERLPIRARTRKIVPLRFNRPQEQMWHIIAPRLDAGQPINLITLKARREGVSTLTEALLTAFAAFEDNAYCKVIAHRGENSQEIWEMSERFVEEGPLKVLAKQQHKSIWFGRSRISHTSAGSPDATRGGDLSALHCSEVASWPDPDAMLAARQCLPQQGFYIFVEESTAKGKTGHGEMFYQHWLAAEAGDTDQIPVFLSWLEMPEYRIPGGTVEPPLSDEERVLVEQFGADEEQLAWRRWAIPNLCDNDEDSFNQEYPAAPNMAFIVSGLPFFRARDLLPLEPDITRGVRCVLGTDGLPRRDPQGYLEVWQPPQRGHTYGIGADSSMGLEGMHSRSAACVIDLESQEQVAEYDAMTAPHAFARHLVALGRWYHNALLAPEVQSSGGGGGREIIVYLREAGYWHLHVWRAADRIHREHGSLFGWETNTRTRPRMIARIRQAVSERSAVIHSKKLLTQLGDFGENESGRLEALSGHDDLLFAWGIALCSRSENYVASVPPRVRTPTAEDFDRLGIRVQGPTEDWSHWHRVRRARRRQAENTALEL